MPRKPGGQLSQVLIMAVRLPGPIGDAARAEVAGLWCEHKTNKAIAAALGCSERHVRRLLAAWDAWDESIEKETAA